MSSDFAAWPPPAVGPRVSARRGFTLVELLVVIGIIALLISILLPALGKAREQGRNVKCKSNMRSLYQACVMFANETKGRCPRGARIENSYSALGANAGVCEERYAWLMEGDGSSNNCGHADFERGALWKYLGNTESRKLIVMCPSDNGEDPMRLGGTVRQPYGYPRDFSYSFNALISDEVRGGTATEVLTRWGVRQNEIIRPTEKIMIIEELACNDGWATAVWAATDDWPSGRHGTRRRSMSGGGAKDTAGTGNHVFFDGHVEEIPVTDMQGTSGQKLLDNIVAR